MIKSELNKWIKLFQTQEVCNEAVSSHPPNKSPAPPCTAPKKATASLSRSKCLATTLPRRRRKRRPCWCLKNVFKLHETSTLTSILEGGDNSLNSLLRLFWSPRTLSRSMTAKSHCVRLKVKEWKNSTRVVNWWRVFLLTTACLMLCLWLWSILMAKRKCSRSSPLSTCLAKCRRTSDCSKNCSTATLW